jgi:hypothetical protein
LSRARRAAFYHKLFDTAFGRVLDVGMRQSDVDDVCIKLLYSHSSASSFQAYLYALVFRCASCVREKLQTEQLSR